MGSWTQNTSRRFQTGLESLEFEVLLVGEMANLQWPLCTSLRANVLRCERLIGFENIGVVLAESVEVSDYRVESF